MEGLDDFLACIAAVETRQRVSNVSTANVWVLEAADLPSEANTTTSAVSITKDAS